MIVGFDQDVFHGKEQFAFPEQKQSTQSIKEILDPDIDEKYTLSDKLWSYLQNYAEKHRAKKWIWFRNGGSEWHFPYFKCPLL